MEWRPIETAPRDGTWILLKGGNTTEDDYHDCGVLKNRPVTAFWLNKGDDSFWAFCFWDGAWREEYEHPTHWMPIK